MNPAASPTSAQPSPHSLLARVGQGSRTHARRLRWLSRWRRSRARPDAGAMCACRPVGEVRAFRQLEDARIVNDAGADIAAAQRNDPAPPAMAHQVVRRPRAARATGIRVIGETLAPFVAVPVLHAREARPDSVDRMLGVLPEMAELAREQRRASARVHEPAAA